jgi:methionine-gamma-lyase
MGRGRIGAIMVETPGNPTNALVDLAMVKALADEIGTQQGYRPPVMADNTFLGPVYQNVLEHGADVALYSLTKYVGGHSDLVAGGATGSEIWIKPIKALRSAIGTQLDPHTSWMIMRSMETLQLRMERANENAKVVADFLNTHPKIKSVWYLGFLPEGDPGQAVVARQCRAPGSTFSFEVHGGEAEAFAMLDAMQVIKLAVSLGGTETLASHPASTTHSGVPRALRDKLGVTDALIRISVGIENAADLVADLGQALERV